MVRARVVSATWLCGVIALAGLGLAGCSADPDRAERTPSTGGSSANGGTTGLGGGGQGGILTSDDQCPADQPEAGSACEAGWYCTFDTCSEGTSSLYNCSNGSWEALRTCDATCPEERPEAFGDCTGFEGLGCAYDEDTCGTEQHVEAMCSNGTWDLYGPDRGEGSPVCEFSHIDGEPCELPDGCERASCYSISCYAAPLVEDCIDGVWRVRTSCSK